MPTRFVFVSSAMADAFWSEWRAIGRRFAAMGDPPEGMSQGEHWDNMASMRRAARAELRETLQASLPHGHGGEIPIQV